MEIALGDNTTTLVASGLAGLGTLAAAARVFWGWFTSLIERFHTEAGAARSEFLKETAAARADFLSALRDIEVRRDAQDTKVGEAIGDLHGTMISIREILRERGIAAPTHGAGAA